MKQVLVFRNELDGTALTGTYDERESLESLMRKHLGKRLKKLHEDRGVSRGARATPAQGSIEDLGNMATHGAGSPARDQHCVQRESTGG
jgi:hypothetical protein